MNHTACPEDRKNLCHEASATRSIQLWGKAQARASALAAEPKIATLPPRDGGHRYGASPMSAKNTRYSRAGALQKSITADKCLWVPVQNVWSWRARKLERKLTIFFWFGLYISGGRWTRACAFFAGVFSSSCWRIRAHGKLTGKFLAVSEVLFHRQSTCSGVFPIDFLSIEVRNEWKQKRSMKTFAQS